METVREVYQAAIENDEEFLLEIIILLTSKKVLKMEDGKDKLKALLNPPKDKYNAWNERYKQGLKERGFIK